MRKLKDFYTQECDSTKLPVNMLFKSRDHEKYCAKFGFFAPKANSSGVWTEGADSRIFINLDYSKEVNQQDLEFKLQYKPYFNSKLKPYEIHWYINGVQVAT